jgi:hypothetical protein
VDYGGVVDLFYKIKSLHEQSVKIHLHCFDNGRGPQPELNKYCEEVNYYQRRNGHKGFSHKLPYIVCSRFNNELLENLLQNEYPILLEGVHCTYLLNDPRFEHRKIILRLHNMECKYYHNLFKSERSLLKKLYFLHESKLLYKYEKNIANRALLLAVSKADAVSFQKEFGAEQIEYLPVFIPFSKVQIQAGKGYYCLYHGNLAVSENEEVAVWLLEKVFKKLKLPLVIAGKNPSVRLQNLVHQYSHACLVMNPDEQEMTDIIHKAQINIITSFNHTGIKLKLINALFNGRHCIVNSNAIDQTGLQPLCHIAESIQDFQHQIRNLYEKPLGYEEIQSREKLLLEHFDNKKNVEKLIAWIW